MSIATVSVNVKRDGVETDENKERNIQVAYDNLKIVTCATNSCSHVLRMRKNFMDLCSRSSDSV